jgi:hypothetical protein
MKTKDQDSATSVLKETALALLLCVSLGGCAWPGRGINEKQFVYRHPSVRWAYRSGGQIIYPAGFGLLLCPVPFPWSHTIDELQASADGVTVVEYASVKAISLWELRVKLDIKSGQVTSVSKNRLDEIRGASGRPDTSTAGGLRVYEKRDDAEYKAICQKARESQRHDPLGLKSEWVLEHPLVDLYVTTNGKEPSTPIRLLTMRLRDPEDYPKPSRAVLLEKEGLLIFLAGDRWVVCVDLHQLPEIRGDDHAPQSGPSN